MKNPLITSEHLQEKLVQPAAHDVAEISLALDTAKQSKEENAGGGVVNKKQSLKEAKRLQKLHKQQLKQQKKKLNKKSAKIEKNNNNSKKRTANGNDAAAQTKAKEDSDRSSGDNEHMSKHLTNVRFAFDEDNNVNAQPEPIEITAATNGNVETIADAAAIQLNNINNNNNNSNVSNNDGNEITSAVIEIIEPSSQCPVASDSDVQPHTKSIDVTDNNGTYDELPLLQIEHDLNAFNRNNIQPLDLRFLNTPLSTDIENGNVDDATRAICFTHSSDSIPFIDESPRRTAPPSVNYHETRFITIQPQNIGSQSYIYARKIEKFHTIKVPKRDQFDKSAQILYQSLKESIDHHFERVGSVESKLCQVCHEFLLVPETVKCLTCGLVCHHSCTASPKVSTKLKNVINYVTAKLSYCNMHRSFCVSPLKST